MFFKITDEWGLHLNLERTEATFEEIYQLLVFIKNQIVRILKTSCTMTVNLSASLPTSWNQFIDYFDMGGLFSSSVSGLCRMFANNECLYTSEYKDLDT